MKKNIRISELILKHLSKEINKEEREELESWLKKNENKLWYEKYKRKIDYDKLTYTNKLYDKKRWISTSKKLGFTKNILHSKNILKYIAILVFLLSIPIIFYLNNNSQIKNNQKKQILAIDLKSGIPKAKLLFDDGVSINIAANNDFNYNKDSLAEFINKDSILIVESILNESIKPVYQTIEVGFGAKYQIILSDGTKVYLNSGSSLRFPSAFTSNFRRVWLEGEGYFDVKHNKLKPFLIATNDLEIEVLGTEFNVNTYNDEEQIYTTLVSGSIKIKDLSVNKYVMVKPNEQVYYSKKTKIFEKKTVDTQMYVSWINGVFSFDNESLYNIMKQLQRWYNMKFKFENTEAKSYRFTGSLERFENVSTLLHMIEETYDVKFILKDDTIMIY